MWKRLWDSGVSRTLIRARLCDTVKVVLSIINPNKAVQTNWDKTEQTAPTLPVIYNRPDWSGKLRQKPHTSGPCRYKAQGLFYTVTLPYHYNHYYHHIKPIRSNQHKHAVSVLLDDNCQEQSRTLRMVSWHWKVKNLMSHYQFLKLLQLNDI